MLIGGAQGTGKTTMALQMARNIASGGQANVLYLCFEHDEAYLMNRLIAMESALAHLPHKTGAIKIQDVRKEILGTWMAEGGPAPQLVNNPRLRPSLDRIARYGQNLYLLRGSQTASTIDNIRTLVEQHRQLSGERRLVVFVDYMQKVPQIPEPENESEKVTYIVNGLKDIALSEEVPMIAIVAADKEGLKASRLRNFHLRGSSAINYEADIILIMNEKYHIVAKVNIEFNPYQAQRFRDWVDRLGREEPRWPGQRGPRVREALRVLLLRPERSNRAGKAHRRTPLQRLATRVGPHQGGVAGSARSLTHLRVRSLSCSPAPFPGTADARLIVRNQPIFLSKRSFVAVVQVLVIAVGIGFFASGLTYVPEVFGVYSPPICGPLKDQFGNLAGDAGPCPSPPILPPPIEAHWEWTAFWAATD